MSDFDTVRDGLFPRMTPVDCGNCRGCRTRAALDRIEAELARLREAAQDVLTVNPDCAGLPWWDNLRAALTQESPDE